MEQRTAPRPDAAAPRPVPWTADAQPAEADYLSVDPTLIEPDPMLGNVREAPVAEEDEAALSSSIAQDGVLQAPAVRLIGPEESPRLAQVWGGRRIEAAKAAGRKRLVVRNLGRIDDATALVYQLVENHVRADLHPVDEARSTLRLVRALGTGTAAADRIGRSEGWVSQMKRIGEALETLEPDQVERLYVPSITKRACIRALQEGGPERVAAWLLERAREPDASRPGRPEGAAGKTRTFRVRRRKRGGGETFTIRWTDADLRRNPEAFTESLLDFLEDRIETIETRLHELAEPESEVSRGREAHRRPPDDGAGESARETDETEPLEALDEERLREVLAATDARIQKVKERIAAFDKRRKGGGEGDDL